MAINLLDIKPHCVSRDLSGYITYIYGAPKTGKTTLATQMGKSLLIAFERGYNALPGVMAQDVTSWSEFRQVYRELKKPEVKATFDAVIVDTVDIAADMCQKYTCNKLGIEALGELGYGKGWTAFKDEFNDVFRGLTQLGYAGFFIGHHKEVQETLPDGTTRTIIRPALSNSTRGVIEGMADLYGYAHQKAGADMSVITMRHVDDSISCGGRFKYIKEEFPMTYDNLVNEMRKAIDREAEEHGGKFVTDEKNQIAAPAIELDYDALMKEFTEIICNIPGSADSSMETEEGKRFGSYWAPKITDITERYLGKGKKVSNCTRQQVEQLALIIDELKEIVKG